MVFSKFQNIGNETQMKMIQDDYLPDDLEIHIRNSLNELFDIIQDLDFNDDQIVNNITTILSEIRHKIQMKPSGNNSYKMVAISGFSVAIEIITLWSTIYKNHHHPLHKILMSTDFVIPSSPKKPKFISTTISTQNDDDTTTSISVSKFLGEKIICIIMYSVFGAVLAPFFFIAEVLLGNVNFALILLILPFVFPIIIQLAIRGSIAGAGAALFESYFCEQLWIIL